MDLSPRPGARVGFAGSGERSALHAEPDDLVRGPIGEIDPLLEGETTKGASFQGGKIPFIHLEEVLGARSGAAGPELPAPAQEAFPPASARSRIVM